MDESSPTGNYRMSLVRITFQLKTLLTRAWTVAPPTSRWRNTLRVIWYGVPARVSTTSARTMASGNHRTSIISRMRSLRQKPETISAMFLVKKLWPRFMVPTMTSILLRSMELNTPTTELVSKTLTVIGTLRPKLLNSQSVQPPRHLPPQRPDQLRAQSQSQSQSQSLRPKQSQKLSSRLALSRCPQRKAPLLRPLMAVVTTWVTVLRYVIPKKKVKL